MRHKLQEAPGVCLGRCDADGCLVVGDALDSALKHLARGVVLQVEPSTQHTSACTVILGTSGRLCATPFRASRPAHTSILPHRWSLMYLVTNNSTTRLASMLQGMPKPEPWVQQLC